jgi:hypothetical protein
MTPQILGAIVRAALQLGGGAALMSDDEIAQLAGAVFAIGSLAWSIYQKVQAKKA